MGVLESEGRILAKKVIRRADFDQTDVDLMRQIVQDPEKMQGFMNIIAAKIAGSNEAFNAFVSKGIDVNKTTKSLYEAGKTESHQFVMYNKEEQKLFATVTPALTTLGAMHTGERMKEAGEKYVKGLKRIADKHGNTSVNIKDKLEKCMDGESTAAFCANHGLTSAVLKPLGETAQRTH